MAWDLFHETFETLVPKGSDNRKRRFMLSFMAWSEENKAVHWHCSKNPLLKIRSAPVFVEENWKLPAQPCTTSRWSSSPSWEYLLAASESAANESVVCKAVQVWVQSSHHENLAIDVWLRASAPVEVQPSLLPISSQRGLWELLLDASDQRDSCNLSPCAEECRSHSLPQKSASPWQWIRTGTEEKVRFLCHHNKP